MRDNSLRSSLVVIRAQSLRSSMMVIKASPKGGSDERLYCKKEHWGGGKPEGNDTGV